MNYYFDEIFNQKGINKYENELKKKQIKLEQMCVENKKLKNFTRGCFKKSSSEMNSNYLREQTENFMVEQLKNVNNQIAWEKKQMRLLEKQTQY